MNTISLNRLKYLFTEYFTLNWIRDVIIFAGFFLVNVVFGCFQVALFLQGIVMIVMVILLSNLFKFVANKPHGMSYLLSPANIAEKFIVNVLISHLYFLLLLIVPIVLGYDAGRLLVASLPDLESAFFPISMFGYGTLLSLFGIQAVFMFGALFFKKRGALKTFLCLMILIITGIIIVVRLVNQLHVENFGGFMDNLIEKYGYIILIFKHIVIFTFWTLSYFRLKRMEV